MKRQSWIDVLKGIAILTVVIDHSFFLFPQLRVNLLWQHTYFSIAWFIFLSGVANTLSAQKNTDWKFPGSYLHFWKKRFSILIPYIIASATAYLFLYNDKFDLKELIRQILFFSAQPTYYFINLICQMYLIFPLLFTLVKSAINRPLRIFLSLAVFFLSLAIFPLGNIPLIWPFSPVGRLLGSTYLSAFFLGILFVSKGKLNKKLLFFPSIPVFIILEYLLLFTNNNFVGLAPNVFQVFWALSLLGITSYMLPLLKFIKSIYYSLAFLGKHSLYIYLYHYLILILLSKIITPSTFLDLFFFVVSAVAGSLAIDYFYQRLMKLTLRKLTF